MKALARISPVLALVGLTGCMEAKPAPERFAPAYHGVKTDLLDGDLVNFHVRMTGARGIADVDHYAECAAAQYALIRGYGFARHIRTQVEQSGRVWHGDAVYTISDAIPDGITKLDAEVVVANCAENGIPMV